MAAFFRGHCETPQKNWDLPQAVTVIAVARGISSSHSRYPSDRNCTARSVPVSPGCGSASFFKGEQPEPDPGQATANTYITK